MSQKSQPVFIQPKDLYIFFHWMKTGNGVAMKYSRMRKRLGKGPGQYISVMEFAEEIGLDYEFVIKKLTE